MSPHSIPAPCACARARMPAKALFSPGPGSKTSVRRLLLPVSWLLAILALSSVAGNSLAGSKNTGSKNTGSRNTDESARAQAAISLPAGILRPMYAPSEKEEQLPIDAFRLDVQPVTNAQMLAFVKKHPEWQRGAVQTLFADQGYLSHWSGKLELGDRAHPAQPVVFVSWFAAKAFCQSEGGRLPSELEWEYAAAASLTAPDARDDAEWQRTILSWYAQPASMTLGRVGQTPKNVYGIQDLHGLVWEWVLEFNSTLVSSDSREGKNAEAARFCGAGAVSASDKGSYAGFMRYAFRSSLEARFTTARLGFRCAYNVKGKP